LAGVLDLVSKASLNSGDPGFIVYNEIWRNCAAKAAEAAGLNQNPALILERFASDIKEAMAAAGK
jgi:hypothetical protein